MKYEVGTILLHKESDTIGEVIPNFNLPGDICVEWIDFEEKKTWKTSYDEAVLDSACEILGEEKLFTVFEMEKLLIDRKHMDFLTPTNAVNERYKERFRLRVGKLLDRLAEAYRREHEGSRE